DVGRRQAQDAVVCPDTIDLGHLRERAANGCEDEVVDREALVGLRGVELRAQLLQGRDFGFYGEVEVRDLLLGGDQAPGDRLFGRRGGAQVIGGRPVRRRLRDSSLLRRTRRVGSRRSRRAGGRGRL